MAISATAIGDPSVAVTGATADATPADIFTDAAGPRLLAVEALVWAEETGLARTNYRHFKLVAQQYVTFEANWQITSTAIAEGGSAGAAAWDAAFVLVANQLTLQVTGAAATTINWRARITIRT